LITILNVIYSGNTIQKSLNEQK